jgi:hypothetical protein
MFRILAACFEDILTWLSIFNSREDREKYEPKLQGKN